MEGELIIENGVTMMFDNDAGINIQKGGRLILREGATLTSFCNESWQGVKVLGNTNLHHPTQAEIDAGNHPNHGYLYTNNATIERAIWGVIVVDEESQSYNFDDGNIIPNANGGGIIQLNNTNFTDNRYGIALFNHGRNQNHKSHIKQCDFVNTYAWEYLPSNTTYRQILLRGADAIPIEQCTFEKNMTDSQSLIDETVIGIEAINGGVLSDSDACPCAMPNSFRNLDKGIKITDLLALGGHFISGNQFYNVKQGITATGAFAVEVNNNIFNDIPAGINNDEATWGIYTDNCVAQRIEQNSFRTTVNSDFTRGLIVKDSDALTTNTEDFNIVKDNSFLGAFEAGILWQGKNDFVDIDCNHFGGTSWDDPKADWQLANSDDFDFSLNEQGCKDIGGIEETEPPFSNQWHDGTSGAHIENLTGITQTLSLNWQDNSEPTLYDINVEVDNFINCGSSSLCINNWGGTGGTTGGNGGTPASNPSSTCRMAYNPIIDNIKSNEKEQVRDEMVCLATDFSHTFLTATNIKEGDLAMAQFYLDKVTDTDKYAIAKVQYQDIITSMQDGTGKSNEAFVRTESKAIKKPLSLENNMAASALAFLSGNTKAKIVDITYNNSLENKPSPKQSFFTIYPNPSGSNSRIQLNLHDSEDVVQVIEISNLNGRILSKIQNITDKYINIGNLSSGIYLITVTTQGGSVYTEKLSVVK